MNRRGFLSSLIAVPAAAWLAPSLSFDWKTCAGSVPVDLQASTIYFKNIPIEFKKYAPSNQIYFLSRNGPHILRNGRITKLSM